MTTKEEKSLTPEDVERDVAKMDNAVEHLCGHENGHPKTCYGGSFRVALAHLRDAALLGTQVPEAHARLDELDVARAITEPETRMLTLAERIGSFFSCVRRAKTIVEDQVAELVADNAALVKAVRIFTENSDREGWTQWLHEEGCRFDPSDDERPCTCDGSFNVGRVDVVLASPHPGASLLAEHEAKVSALQARVTELTRERDEDRAAVEAMAQAIEKHLPGFHPAQSPDEGIHLLAGQRDEARAERDALRAQAEALVRESEFLEQLHADSAKDLPEGHLSAAYRRAAQVAKALGRMARAALSTPPAEGAKLPAIDMRGWLGPEAVWTAIQYAPPTVQRDAHRALTALARERCELRDTLMLAEFRLPNPPSADATVPTEDLARKRGERRRRHHSLPPQVPPLAERINAALATVGCELPPVGQEVAEAGAALATLERTVTGLAHNTTQAYELRVQVGTALAKVWPSLHVTTADEGAAVAVLRAVYPGLPVPVASDAVRRAAEDMRELAARTAGSVPMIEVEERIRALPLPGEEMPRG
ncbi:hypothetical protein OV208_15220 [Corallococcus sp. bb12-1]|uniref:hypothetical protein n=1 Tax=Corallococcus sp. bb12-1 TaxID=2996784 RepID=UPI00227123D4|nr:hypothetical protein [Corallococcus sp. bb12-1]MCY1042674.1 hypothetical protein [Corallococcus sp. bb12-1]